MKLKYLLVFLLISLSYQSIRFHDEQMLQKHHNHSSVADTPLIVYLMPHSHDDVGWLKTVDDYFYGGDQRTQWASVRLTIESVISQLSLNSNYKFSIVQMAFLYRWWNTANQTQKELLKKHIQNKQIQIINGGWCMHDQATTYYQDIIDQMTTGLTWLKNTLNVVPTIGWHIDPFGHQSSNAALFSQFGFNAWFFSRIDYQDKQVRLSKKAFQMVWHPYQYSGNDNYIFSHVNYNNYAAPPSFCFDNNCEDNPIKDDPTLQQYNIDERAQNLTNYFKSMATHYRSSNLFHTIGEDFHYSNARMWYKNFDKLIKYINDNSTYRVTLKYGTPTDYINVINLEGNIYPTKTDDFYPYADRQHAYWTGYFTSRVSLKSLVKQQGRYLQSIRNHISFLKLTNRSDYINNNPNQIQSAIWQMQMAQGVLQHHDAVAGTSKQKVANDYVRITSKAYSVLHNVYDEIRKQIVNKEIGETPTSFYKTLWNTTGLEWGISSSLNSGKNVLLQIYNPGPNSTHMIRIKIDNSVTNINIIDSTGSIIKGDLICSNSLNNKDCELIFNIGFKQASYSYVKLKKVSSGGSVKVHPLQNLSSLSITKTFTFTSTSKMTFTKSTNKMQFTTGNHTYTIIPSYNYYQSYQSDGQKSGAYIFRPSDSTINATKKYTTFKSYHYSQGDFATIFVFEGDKTYTKFYFSKIPNQIDQFGFEVETFVNSIDISDNKGKEIIFSIEHHIQNNKTFYTDSNGLEEMKRITNYRPTWNLNVNEAISGNYYPVNSHIKVVGSNNTQLSIIVDRAQGATACREGIIDLMIHRRTLEDDSRGVAQPLNETESDNKGLTQKIRHWIVFGQTPRKRQKINDQPVVITWSQSDSESFMKSDIPNASFPVPSDVKIFLRPYNNDTYLLRIHNFNSFTSKTVNLPIGYNVIQTTLGGNQLLSEWKDKQMKWKDEPYTLNEMQTLRKRTNKIRVQDEQDSLNIKPFEIRTFILSKTD